MTPEELDKCPFYMNFSEALEAMRAGKKVRLQEMKDYFLYISTVYEMTFNTSRKVSHIRLTNYKDEQDWTPDEEELLSEKWEIVDEYPKVKILQYFKCPRCNENSHFDRISVDSKGREIIECEHCKNKVEIEKEQVVSNACGGETKAKYTHYTLPVVYMGYRGWRVTKPLPVNELTIKVRRDIENGKL